MVRYWPSIAGRADPQTPELPRRWVRNKEAISLGLVLQFRRCFMAACWSISRWALMPDADRGAGGQRRRWHPSNVMRYLAKGDGRSPSP